MFSWNYQILDISRANDILLQKKGEKKKSDSIRGCFNVFILVFCKIILRNKGTETDFGLLMDVGLI